MASCKWTIKSTFFKKLTVSPVIAEWRSGGEKKIGPPKEWHSDVERLKPEEHYQAVAKKQQGAGVENEDTKGHAPQALARGLCPHALPGIGHLPDKTHCSFPSGTFSPGVLTLRASSGGEGGMVPCTFSCSPASRVCIIRPLSPWLVPPRRSLTIGYFWLSAHRRQNHQSRSSHAHQWWCSSWEKTPASPTGPST